MLCNNLDNSNSHSNKTIILKNKNKIKKLSRTCVDVVVCWGGREGFRLQLEKREMKKPRAIQNDNRRSLHRRATELSMSRSIDGRFPSLHRSLRCSTMFVLRQVATDLRSLMKACPMMRWQQQQQQPIGPANISQKLKSSSWNQKISRPIGYRCCCCWSNVVRVWSDR